MFVSSIHKIHQQKILALLSQLACPVWQFMSLISLLTATEKQVYLGQLHMRPIQWHLKKNWRVPESLEKVIPIPRSLHPQLKRWLEESNLLQGQPLLPLKQALQIFTDTSKEGWGAHLNEHTARETLILFCDNLHLSFAKALCKKYMIYNRTIYTESPSCLYCLYTECFW